MKQNNEVHFVWIDLEMTGLDPQRHVILEIAAIVTDVDLAIRGTHEAIVIAHQSSELESMDSWSRIQHTKSGLLDAVNQSSIKCAQAERAILSFIQQYCVRGAGLLAGNSVWQDRNFLQRYMPSIVDYLHYRLIDVSSFKEVITRWYPGKKETLFSKRDNHRAHEDILESIEELRHYRHHFFV